MGGEDRELIGAVPFICNNCAEMQFFQCNVHGSVQCGAECRAFDIETVEMHDQCFRSKKQQQGISSSFSPVECSRIEFSPVQGLNSQFILFKHLQKKYSRCSRRPKHEKFELFGFSCSIISLKRHLPWKCKRLKLHSSL